MWRFFKKPVGQVFANTSTVLATTIVAEVTYNAGASVYQAVNNSSLFQENPKITTEKAKYSSPSPYGSNEFQVIFGKL